MITSVQYSDEENAGVTAVINGIPHGVPVDAEGNRHWQMVKAWIAEGNTIQPYEPSPVEPDPAPTIGDLRAELTRLAQRIDRLEQSQRTPSQ